MPAMSHLSPLPFVSDGWISGAEQLKRMELSDAFDHQLTQQQSLQAHVETKVG